MATLSLRGTVEIAFAQITDPSQLEQLGYIQDSQDARRVALQRAQEQAQRQAARQMAAQKRAAAQAKARAYERAQADRAAQIAQQTREHQDDRSYLDANRSLNLQERQLKLKLAEARANHAEDYVKQELNQQQTNTDNVSLSAQGNQKLKEDVGQAMRMSQRHWWQK